jgi:hypothetical protein
LPVGLIPSLEVHGIHGLEVGADLVLSHQITLLTFVSGGP